MRVRVSDRVWVRVQFRVRVRVRARVGVRVSGLRAVIALGTLAQHAPHARLAAGVAARLAVEDLLAWLQPLAQRVAASSAYGCIYHLGLQHEWQ